MRFPVAFSGVCGAAVRRRVTHQPAMCSASPSPAPSPSTTPESPGPVSAVPVPSPVPAAVPPPAPAVPTYCTYCAGVLKSIVPPGDERQRLVCSSCERVMYENPKVVCATVAISSDTKRVLLAKRKIWPRQGYWGIPAGFLELGESADAGAQRECYEECYAKLRKQHPPVLLAVYSVLPAKQVQLVYRATIDAQDEAEIRAGIETMETHMFEWDNIPWDQLAFPTCEWALKHARNTMQETHSAPKVQHRSKLPDGSFVDTPVPIA